MDHAFDRKPEAWSLELGAWSLESGDWSLDAVRSSQVLIKARLMWGRGSSLTQRGSALGFAVWVLFACTVSARDKLEQLIPKSILLSRRNEKDSPCNQ